MRHSRTRRRAAKEPTLPERPVSALMSTPVVAVSYRDTLDGALRALVVMALHHLAVVDDDGRCVGLVNDRLIAANWARDPFSLDEERVGDRLDPAQPILPVAATVAESAATMRRCGTDAVVLVNDGGAPVGVLTAADIIAALCPPPPERPLERH